MNGVAQVVPGFKLSGLLILLYKSFSEFLYLLLSAEDSNQYGF
jgi:hypothetical protein